ncbi:MAG: triphosphoribosyl-dephospho-CoA synthase [Planctomycetes bacterium]|nr:triphosphoribosyl-dephospho-CoA synthase [Planctomycetota bacterium]
MLPVGLCVQLACVWEATARKPGNVHRYRDFADVTYLDFILSAAAIAPVLEGATSRPVGQTILEAGRATRLVARTNTNLGILLLLSPLAAVPAGESLRDGLLRVLDRLNIADARAAYEAIRRANPGGLGRVQEQDVTDEPTLSLREVMALAADRDLIARQYVNGYEQVFEEGVPALRQALERGATPEEAIIGCHLHLLARHPDSLIVRKRGPDEAREASWRAQHVLDAGWASERGDWQVLEEFDRWLREEGHTRNPGTTADLVAACLFAGLREDAMTPLAAFC